MSDELLAGVSSTGSSSSNVSNEETPSTSITRRGSIFVDGPFKTMSLQLSIKHKPNTSMADAALLMQPKSMVRPKVWDEEVEEAYRFQLAGYRDAIEYKHFHKTEHIDRWPHNGYVKKLVRKDGYFYYYNKSRECPDKEVNKTKMYSY